MISIFLFVLFTYITAITTAAQTPLNANTHTSELLPINLSFSAYSTLSHSYFPRHSVRVKKTKFCDTTVNAYTGYIDIDVKHIFFYFFESRNSPGTDDVILWTNGGAGCSSAMGLFMEHGPCRILNADGPKYHHESWNSNANIIYIDQPIGAGFSYAEHGQSVSTSEEAAQDIAAFLAIFFDHFSNHEGRALHLTGESYAGRMVPLFAAALYDQNRKMVKAGHKPINLDSIAIGNGRTDYYTGVLSLYDITCTPASIYPVLDIQTCTRMKSLLQRCERWMKESCMDSYDVINCEAAAQFCYTSLGGPMAVSGINPYYISKDCEGTYETTMCYPFLRHITDYLKLSSTRNLLGVDPEAADFAACNYDVLKSFGDNHDEYALTPDYVTALLEHGVRVLIYAGDLDWICNWIGNERWTYALEWSGSKGFQAAPKKEWKGGLTRTYGGLTFATIRGGGHMAPYDKPLESRYMIERWMKKEEL